MTPRALALLLLLAACARPVELPQPPEAPRLGIGGAFSATWGAVR